MFDLAVDETSVSMAHHTDAVRMLLMWLYDLAGCWTWWFGWVACTVPTT